MPSAVPSKPVSDLASYSRVLIFGLILFEIVFAYSYWLDTPKVLNKTTADTAIILMGLSMILSGVCYFWDAFDKLIRYRKFLGMIGWAFALAHVVVSYPALLRLLSAINWQKGIVLPAVCGSIAMIIFTIMALVSNIRMAKTLGKWWRVVLRVGYVGVIFVFFHVTLLMGPEWIAWFRSGMASPPTMAFVVSVFMLIVILMRVALWIALKRKAATAAVPFSSV